MIRWAIIGAMAATAGWWYYPSEPAVMAGATAICRDGAQSFSDARRGTCSHHGGVKEWIE